jgi:hypothetical protein
VDADDAHLRAAVGASPEAGGALPAGYVGVHRAAIAGTEILDVIARGDNLNREFVTEYTRIAEKRLRAFEGVQVCAANADSQDANQSFAGAGRLRASGVGESEVFGMIE